MLEILKKEKPKSATIKFKDGKVEIIEVSTTKKVVINSRFLTYFSPVDTKK